MQTSLKARVGCEEREGGGKGKGGKRDQLTLDSHGIQQKNVLGLKAL